MSRGDDIQIDTDELQDVLKAISTKSPAIIRNGIFNPSFYVSIIKDTKREYSFFEDIKYEDNKQELKLIGVPKLRSMFDDTVLKLKTK